MLPPSSASSVTRVAALAREHSVRAARLRREGYREGRTARGADAQALQRGAEGAFAAAAAAGAARGALEGAAAAAEAMAGGGGGGEALAAAARRATRRVSYELATARCVVAAHVAAAPASAARPSPEADGAVAARVAGAERPLGGEERAFLAALLQEVKGSMLPGLDETAEHVL